MGILFLTNYVMEQNNLTSRNGYQFTCLFFYIQTVLLASFIVIRTELYRAAIQGRVTVSLDSFSLTSYMFALETDTPLIYDFLDVLRSVQEFAFSVVLLDFNGSYGLSGLDCQIM